MGVPMAPDPPSRQSHAHLHMRPQSSYEGCSSIRDYELLGKLGEGTFGEVYKAKARRSGRVVAMKKIIMHNEKDGFPITALREIKLLKLLSHPNVLKLEDMAVEHPHKGSDKRKRPIMYMVTPYMDHDLSGLLENPSVKFSEPQIKCYLMQLLEGLRYLHENHILHRDMKAANLLINNSGILQIADFGLARHYEGEVPQPGRGGGEGRRDYTSLVVTRWYRPPELLLQLKRYTSAIDVWGVGCVFGEMLGGKPILAGISDSHQLEIIWDLCGSPTEDNMPGWKTLPGAQGLTPRSRPNNISMNFAKYGPGAVSLLTQLLKLDWRSRINAMDALQHPYFRTAPFPAKPGDIPTFEESHELDRRKFDDRKAALPPAPKGGTVGRGHMEGANGPNSGFDGDGYGRNGANGNHRHGQSGYANERVPRGPGGGPMPQNGGGGGGGAGGGGGGGGGADEGGGRRPPWARERQPHGLPPRPPPPTTGDPLVNGRDSLNYSEGYRDRDRDRDWDRDRDRSRNERYGPPPRSRGGRDNDVDTYIPPARGYPRGDGGAVRDVNRDATRDRLLPTREDRRRHDDRDEPVRHSGRDRHDGPVRRSRSRSPLRERDRDRDAYRR